MAAANGGIDEARDWGTRNEADRDERETMSRDERGRDSIPVGAGTEVTRSRVNMRRVKDARCGAPQYEIEQAFTLKFTAKIGVGSHWRCVGCDAEPKLSEQGAEFILANNDGDRLHFPEPEDCEDERDCFPVTGWTTFPVDEENKLICGECHAEQIRAITGRRKPK